MPIFSWDWTAHGVVIGCRIGSYPTKKLENGTKIKTGTVSQRLKRKNFLLALNLHLELTSIIQTSRYLIIVC